MNVLILIQVAFPLPSCCCWDAVLHRQRTPWPPPTALQLVSFDAELCPLPWPSFNMVGRCSVRCHCDRFWKPPWPIQICQQIRFVLTNLAVPWKCMMLSVLGAMVMCDSVDFRPIPWPSFCALHELTVQWYFNLFMLPLAWCQCEVFMTDHSISNIFCYVFDRGDLHTLLEQHYIAFKYALHLSIDGGFIQSRCYLSGVTYKSMRLLVFYQYISDGCWPSTAHTYELLLIDSNWEEDHVIPLPPLQIWHVFSGVHSIDSDYGPIVVPSSRVTLAWVSGGLEQIIYSWSLFFAHFDWCPEFFKGFSNQCTCKCSAIYLELPWMFCWNYGLVCLLGGVANVAVVLLLQTFVLLPKQHEDGFFSVSNEQAALPVTYYIYSSHCIELQPRPPPATLHTNITSALVVTISVGYKLNVLDHVTFATSDLTMFGYDALQLGQRKTHVVRYTDLKTWLVVQSSGSVVLCLAARQAPTIIVEEVVFPMDGDNSKDANYFCVTACFVDAGWKLPRRTTEIYFVHLIIDRRAGLLLGVDKWGLIILPAYIHQGVFPVDNVHVVVVVTIAETGAALGTSPAMVWLSNWLCSRLLWKPPWELPALVEFVDASLDDVVDDEKHEHEEEDADHAESIVPNAAARHALPKDIGRQLSKTELMK